MYIEQILGYVAQGETQVCKLKNAIYGLKQSLCAWFTKFSKVIGHVGLRMCNADHSVFVRQTSKGCVILNVYVDDILLTESDSAGIEESKTKKHFVTKDLEHPRYFLGIKIAHTKDIITLSQRKYVLDLL